MLSELVNQSLFTRAELLKLAQQYTNSTQVHPGGCLRPSKSPWTTLTNSQHTSCFSQSSLALNADEFASLVKRYMPRMGDTELIKRVVGVMDLNGDGSVSFQEFALGLSKAMRGSMVDKMEFVFSMLDADGTQARASSHRLLLTLCCCCLWVMCCTCTGTGEVEVTELVPIVRTGNEELKTLIDFTEEVNVDSDAHWL